VLRQPYSRPLCSYPRSDTSITDPWARMISYHFLNQTSRSNFFTNDTGTKVYKFDKSLLI
jgi:hypothetical protein